MMKASINLQGLRRKIYLKAKSEKTWSVMASVGTGGVELGLSNTKLKSAANPIGHINF